MLTSTSRIRLAFPLSAVALVAGLAGIAVVLAVRFNGNVPTGATAESLPADVAALGMKVEPLSPNGMITADQAIGAFEAALGPFPEAKVEAYLVALTDPTVLGGLQARALWILKYTGTDWPYPLPNAPGADDLPQTVGDKPVYIYVDAVNGEFLMGSVR